MTTALKRVLPLLWLALSLLPARAAWDGTVATAYAGGDGTRENPYLIATAEQLAKFAQDVNTVEGFSRGRYFMLSADIVMHEGVMAKGVTALNGGKAFTQTPMVGVFTDETTGTPFEGVFDGDGHTISGLYTEEYAVCVSLFRVTNGATIKNLGVIDSYFYGNARFAGIVGKMTDSKLLNCYVRDCHLEGYGSYAGALVGQCVGSSEIVNCYAQATLKAKNNAGGIVGRIGDGNANACVVDNCLSLVSITTTKTNKAGVSSENCEGAIVRHCIHQEALPTTISSNKGTVEEIQILPEADLAGETVVETLNARAELLPGACRWTQATPCPELDYTVKTPSDDDPDYSAMATGPYPTDGDLHAEADEGSITLRWSAAIDHKTVSQQLYISTDKECLGEAETLAATLGTDTCHTVTLSQKNTVYYWRVDRTDAEGNLTKGSVWSFMPRQLAFPGAEGYGRFAQGGRGGKVVYVTNLNARGAGSFHQAVTSGEGPRTVVFAVSGLITLDNDITCDDNITIAGQTAPGKGVCFMGGTIGVANDNICRFIRSRRGGTADTGGSIGFYYADHAIIDHVTASWGTDETFSSRSCRNITFQRSIISEALGIAGHRNYAEGTNHGYAATIGGDIGSFHHNLLADCYGRNWSMGGGTDANGHYAGRLDIFNNVVYNWGTRTTDGGAHEVNFVNNYYKMGPATTLTTLLTLDIEGNLEGTQSIYVSGNIRDNKNGTLTTDKLNDTYCLKIRDGRASLDWEPFVSEPFFPSYATIETAKEAYKSTLSDVGAHLPMADDTDLRIIGETLNRTYTYTGSKSGLKGQIDNESDAGGYEIYPEESRPEDYDTDKDGLPDWWEELHGTDTHSAAGDFTEANSDADGDGYTALEDYLHFMSAPHLLMQPGVQQNVTLAPLFAGYTDAPVYTVEGDNLQTSLADGVLTVTATEEGLYTLYIKVTDGAGASYTRPYHIAVTKNEAAAIDQTAADVSDFSGLHIVALYALDGTLLGRQDISLSDLKAGVYLVKANDRQGRSKTYKVVKR